MVDADLAVPYSTRWMEKQLQAAVDHIGPGLGWNPTFGSLRWTYAVHSLQKGASEEAVRQCLGISEIAWEMHTRKRLMRHAPKSAPVQTA
jgi:site-specific recombinase XerD